MVKGKERKKYRQVDEESTRNKRWILGERERESQKGEMDIQGQNLSGEENDIFHLFFHIPLKYRLCKF